MTLVVGENTYLDVDAADAYFADRYNSSEWIDSDNPTKEQLLISATRVLDLFCNWSGYKNADDQLLSFPRNNEPTPEKIKMAECEIALSILSTGSVVSETEPALKKLKADVVEFIFGDSKEKQSLYNNFTNDLLTGFCENSSCGCKRLIRV